ncbi:MAG: tRNA glutamyl-Q(34) synthetase GluQRS [Roseobacter sp.]
MTFRTRFAPSPTGPLHLGHAYSALLAFDMARAENGTFLLRIEDIDQSRSRQHWVDQIYTDLRWLGIEWPEPVFYQSRRINTYVAGLEKLRNLGVVYPCVCSRRDIQAAASAPQEGTPLAYGPDGLIYPGTCRISPPQDYDPAAVAYRLDMEKTLERLEVLPRFSETGRGTPIEHVLDRTLAKSGIGDIVLARRDMGTSYHLSVVLDDAAQRISHIVRGEDLFHATYIHVILQVLLGLPTPVYHHHRLIRDAEGKRLAKRDDARAISKYRDDGFSPAGIRETLGLAP